MFRGIDKLGRPRCHLLLCATAVSIALPQISFSAEDAPSDLGCENLALVGEWTNGAASAVVVEGDLAYFRNGPGLQIVDITNLSDPQEINRKDLG